MAEYSFNAQEHQPSYGSNNSALPPGDYTVVIVNSEKVQNAKKNGGFLAFDLAVVDGPLKDQKHTDRLNLMNQNPTTVEIANKQLSAYCHVLGVFQFNDTTQLHGIPFKVTIGYQKGHEPTEEKPEGGYTEVKELFDINGNEPGKAGSGQSNGQSNATVNNSPPPEENNNAGGVQATGGWGSSGQSNQQDQGQNNQQDQGWSQNNNNSNGGWGNPNG